MAVPFDLIQLFDGGSGALDGTKLAAGARGASMGTWQVADLNTIEHTVIENHTAELPFDLAVAGVDYDGSDPGGITFDHTGSPEEHDVFELLFTPDTYTTMQALGLVRLDIVNDGLQDYYIDLLAFQASDSSYGVAQAQHNYQAALNFRAHASTANGLTVVPSATGQWAIVCVAHNRSTGQTEVVLLDAMTGAFVGSSFGTHTTGGSLYYFRVQDYLRTIDGLDKSGSIKVKLIALREDVATFPAVPITVPDAQEDLCAQTGAGEITVAWTSGAARHRVERRIDGGSWATIATNTLAHSIVDDGLADGAAVEYRVTALVGTYEAPGAAFGPVTVDDAGLVLSLYLSELPDFNNQSATQVGMRFTVGADDLEFVALGLKITAALASNPIGVGLYDNAGVLLGSVLVPTDADDDAYHFVDLETPITLSAGASYYLMTSVLTWSDTFEFGTLVTSTSAITVNDSAAGVAPSFTLTGYSAPRVHGPVNALYKFPSATEYELSCDPGTYGVTGSPASPLAHRRVSGDPGAYITTGADAVLRVGHVLVTDAGVYALTGAAATLSEAARVLHADAGSYAVAGSDATFARGYVLSVDAGVYDLAGADADLVRIGAVQLTADPGVYAVTGAEALLRLHRRLVADPGSYSVTGVDALHTLARALTADPGVYDVTGAEATLQRVGAYELTAEPGTYTVTGVATALHAHRTLTADAGTYALTGADLDALRALALAAEPGAYGVSGMAASLLYSGLVIPASIHVAGPVQVRPALTVGGITVRAPIVAGRITVRGRPS